MVRSIKLAWAGIGASLLLIALFLTLNRAALAAQTEPADPLQAVEAAANWLVLQHQNEDGGYTAFSTGAGEASDVAGTLDALLALSSAGYNVAAPYPGREHTPVDYLAQNPAALAGFAAQGGGATGKLILALVAAGQNPRTFAGHNFVISLTNHLSPTGQYNVVAPFEQSLAMLAQVAVSGTVPVSATQWLLERQADEGDVAGSWDDGYGTQGNTDGTALAIMALVASGEPVTSTALSKAAEFLAQTQLESGGWGYAPDAPESANSTALAVQALSALGEDFYSEESSWARNGNTPFEALLSWQSESGAVQADFGEGPADDFFTTVQALPALSGKPYPLPGRYESARRAVACLGTLRDPATGGWEEFAGTGPNAGGTSRALQALAAFGEDVTAVEWDANGQNALAVLETLAPDYLAGGRGGRAGIVMQGAEAAGGLVTDVNGLDLVVSMTNYLSPTGEYDNTAFGPFSHAEAMLGLMAAGQNVDPSAVDWLLMAHENGDWGSPDATGVSLQVLAGLGQLPADLRSVALNGLRTSQQADGGWGQGLPSSMNSTAEVAHGLVALGENPFEPAWSQVMSGTVRNAADALLAQQGANGCWPNQFGPGDDPYATTDAILLLSLQPPWGRAPEAVPGAQETPTTMVTPTAEVTPTVASTAEPIATEEPAITPTEAVTVTPSATSAPVDAAETDASGSRISWATIGVLVLLLLGGAALVWRGRR